MITRHGTNAECPDVQAGRATRCPGHQTESPAEHIRNALQVLTWAAEIPNTSPSDGGRISDRPVILTRADYVAIVTRLNSAINTLEGKTP